MFTGSSLCQLALVAILFSGGMSALAQSVQDSSYDAAHQGLPMIPWTATGTSETAISADQAVAILQQHPQMMASMKTALEHSQGVDAGSITDAEVYQHIREDDGFREEVSQQLLAKGYGPKEKSAEQDIEGDPDLNDGTPPADHPDTPDKAPSPVRKINQPAAESGSYRSKRTESSQKIPVKQSAAEGDKPEPNLLHRRNPYGDLPSLRDLYSQISPQTGKLRRFGSDTFRLGTGNAEELPLDLPVGPDYVLGPGDNLILNLWGGQSQRLNRTIDRQGQIALPEAGTVTISGLTIAQAQAAIQSALGTQFQNEHVEISLGRLRTVRVYVVGDVQRPGAYDLSSLSTPMNALYTAGGPTSRGSLRVLRQYRGPRLVREIDLYDLLLKGVRSEIDRLNPGDTILVPPAGAQVSVAGAVRRPAIYELKGEQDLNDVLELAGGTLVSANLKQISIERVEAHERHTMLSVHLTSDAQANSRQLVAFHVQDGDSVLVTPILPYNEQAVYLDGHLFRPGRYPYHDGMTVNDLLRSYQDVMPEPAEHAEIIRLQAPDFRPETISFNLSDVLTGDDPITLEPFDVIRVFSRYEIDPPKVSIRGDVLRPGDYPLSQGMTATGLLNMAGGFKRSAYQDEADLSSYVIQGGQKVLIHHSVIEVKRALEGDKSADVVLKPGDMVGVRQLTGWQDIGASVTVQGEVLHAGTYGLEEGERLSSLLKRTGGFREEAYAAGAVLERNQVREMGERSRQEMIRRIETTAPSVKPGLAAAQEQSSLLQTMQEQRQQVLTSLRSHPATGRLVIKISSDISKWENTPADIEMRAGDRLLIPKRPDFVVVSGQVYNPTALSFSPGRDASWYLRQAGGVTQSGDKKDMFIVRADGSVVGRTTGIWGADVEKVHLHPGDSLVIPEKVVGGSQFWKNVIGAAQIMSSVAITGAAAGIF